MARLRALTQLETAVLTRRTVLYAGIFALAGMFRLKKGLNKLDIEKALLNYN